MIKLTKRYFECFSNQDIDALSDMFSDNITLKDWNTFVSGKRHVLDVIKGIYEAVTEISVVPTLIVSSGNTVISEISINVNSEIIEAVDVIEYSDGKIMAIRAYKN